MPRRAANRPRGKPETVGARCSTEKKCCPRRERAAHYREVARKNDGPKAKKTFVFVRNYTK
eukprot:11931273-Alexandrium_andersonii.AAC.1